MGPGVVCVSDPEAISILTLNMLDSLPVRASGGVGEQVVTTWLPVDVCVCACS